MQLKRTFTTASFALFFAIALTISPRIIFGEEFSIQDQTSAVSRETTQTILNKVFPELDVTMLDEQDGTAKIDGQTSPLRVNFSAEMNMDGKAYAVVVVLFSGPKSEAPKRFLEGGDPVPPKYKNVLLIARTTPPYEAKKIVIDSHELGGGSDQAEVGDFIGDGTQQLRLIHESVYGIKSDQPQYIMARRLYLYRIPSAERLFVTTMRRLVLVDEKLLEPAGQKIVEFIPDGNGKPKNIHVLDPETRIGKIVPCKNGKYKFEDDEPWKARDPSESTSKNGASKLKIQVLDEEGQPIVGAKIFGFVKKISMLRWSDTNKDFTAETDKNGEFSKGVGDKIGIRSISASGYYSVKNLYWDPNEVPKEKVVITLQKELPRVPVYAKGWSTTWKEVRERFEIGIRLIDTKRFSRVEANQRVVTQDKNNADIWVEIFKTGETPVDPPRREWQWRIRITGQNGWELAPGPMKADNYDHPLMREAPEEGYVEQLEYDSEMCPQGIFLRLDGGKRYGKLTDFKFADRSGASSIQQHFWADFLVQAVESNTRSLNPER